MGNAPDTAAAGHSPEDLAAAERAAEAHAQELLQEELAAKVSSVFRLSTLRVW